MNKNSSQLRKIGQDSEVCRRLMFYSAIENSNCEGYISEKLLKAVSCQAIPIVYSPNNYPNYLKRLPKGSFINVYDYPTAESLVEELRTISLDRNRYEQFFEAKRLPPLKKQKLENTILYSQGEGRWNLSYFCQLARLKKIGKRYYGETSLAKHMGNCVETRNTLLNHL